ncbi:MAG: UPF0147 family protein [Candidatus Marsarchaeota archaeon]|nr:UPF0147 family protein [Candidatus Marsarchaeota archaeon]
MNEKEVLRQMLSSLIEDGAIPKNIRTRIEEVSEKMKEQEDMPTLLSMMTYSLEDIVNDVNLPMHARTNIWNILSEIEMLKEKHRKK